MPKDHFYITTPIYYVNAKPHLGSLYSTLLADVAARWHQLQGQKTFLLTGTDEHGQKVAEAAALASKQPKEFIDSLVPFFKNLWNEYEIKYNHFIRTTDDYHVKAVQEWIKLLQEKGDIYKATYEGWYCQSSEAFLTEKDLEFRTPGEPPISLLCDKPARWVSEEAYFFRLSAYQDKLLEFYKNNPDFITPPERMHEVVAFVEGGLKDLSISRKTITWGIPFPGDKEHVTYVWADALNNYITAIGWRGQQPLPAFKTWWPADVHVLGKDIVRFHAVYWPAFLMATGLELPKKLLVHGWIKVDGQKMSKSLGNVVDPTVLAQEYGVEPVRYYLTRYMAITQDSSFGAGDLEEKINADLANDLGNFLNRLSTLALNQNMRHINAPSIWTDDEQQLIVQCRAMVNDAEHHMQNYYFHHAYASVWKFIHALNAYFHKHEPWKLAKNNQERFAQVMSAACHGLYAVALLVWPVMPESMEKLLGALGKTIKADQNYFTFLRNSSWHENFTLTKIDPLFKKFEKAETMEEKKSVTETSNLITIDDLMKVELLVGEIQEVIDIPESEKIYKMRVDFGTHGTRTICAGVKKYYKPEELVGKKTVFAFNLKPRMLMGIESQGMMMLAKNKQEVPTIILVDAAVQSGTRLS
jgi:methionyl-tRNA synthetase